MLTISGFYMGMSTNTITISNATLASGYKNSALIVFPGILQIFRL